MSNYPRLIEKRPGVDRSDSSWRRGALQYDLSQDERLAAAGDENAEARLRTKRRLDLRKRVGS